MLSIYLPDPRDHIFPPLKSLKGALRRSHPYYGPNLRAIPVAQLQTSSYAQRWTARVVELSAKMDQLLTLSSASGTAAGHTYDTE